MGAFVAIAIAMTAGILLLGEDKTASGLLFFVYLLLVYLGARMKFGFRATNKFLLYVILASIPFPYLIQYQGKDAMTVTTLLIFFFLMIAVFEAVIRGKYLSFRMSPAAFIPLALVASLTATLAANTGFLGQALRYYLANLSGVVLYFILTKTVKTKADFVRIVKVIVISLLAQAVLSFLQLKYPSVTGFLNVFGTRTENTQAQVIEGMLRATGTVWDYELLAEWFLVGAILSLYLTYITGRYRYIGAMLVNVAGILFTKTRSDALLFAAVFAGMFVVLKLMKKDRKHIMSATVAVSLAAMAAGVFLFSELIGEMIVRMQMFLTSRTPMTAEAINRKEVWATALSLLREPTFLGAGLHNVQQEGAVVSFHSLYMTLLYKVGYFGLITHIIFWLFLFKEGLTALFKNIDNDIWYGAFFLTAACFVLLVDGGKVEYLRYAHTIQFVWMVFGLWAASTRIRKEENESALVPPAAI